MSREVIIGIMIPFAGTILGAGMVFLLKDTINTYFKKPF